MKRREGANISYSLRQRDKIGDMFRRTVGLNVEACNVFWIRFRCFTGGTRKRFAHSVARALLGVAVFMAPMPRALAQKVPTDIGILGSPDGPIYPLKASGNNRYLVDQNNVPFLMVGDAPQTLIANLSQAEAATYMANRRTYGINTLWINLLCNFSDGCKKDAVTFDGISPFIVPGDLSTPNPAYFQRADDMINIAAENGMVVLLDPIETSSWLDILRANGAANAFAYGQYLGERYRAFPLDAWQPTFSRGRTSMTTHWFRPLHAESRARIIAISIRWN
jgi:Protein of unknown function (DUF4038)